MVLYNNGGQEEGLIKGYICRVGDVSEGFTPVPELILSQRF